jgi:hypothetical protein
MQMGMRVLERLESFPGVVVSATQAPMRLSRRCFLNYCARHPFAVSTREDIYGV